MTDDDDNPAAFALAHDPAVLAARVLRLPEHANLLENEVHIGYVFRGTPKEKGGKTELGSVHVVRSMFQGGFKDMALQMLETFLGHLPEFLVVLDAQWWTQASDRQREALIFHELCHIKQKLDQYGAPRFDRDGNPVFGIVEHDITAFNDEVARYGAWTPSIQQFLNTADAA